MLQLHSCQTYPPPSSHRPAGQLAHLSTSDVNTKYSDLKTESYPTPAPDHLHTYSFGSRPGSRLDLKFEASSRGENSTPSHCKSELGMSRRRTDARAPHSQATDSNGYSRSDGQTMEQSYDGTAHTYNSTMRAQRYPTGPGRPSSKTTSRAASPVIFVDPVVPDPAQIRRGSKSTAHHAVASYLHLPPEIANGRPASLAEFAAQITCLFWFESVPVLKRVEEAVVCPTPFARLAKDARPVTGFLKWVTTILTTTQVASNVVLLALMFIYRLKKQNPQVQGKSGSEFRLLTVALMLGNKFLDDNTYTNKTWAEVSGISVGEIHVMEVEFLSHMKYNLYTSKEQWKDWFGQLNRFWTYYEWAETLDVTSRPSSQQDFMTTAVPQRLPYPLPSPPESTAAASPYASASQQGPPPTFPLQLAPITIPAPGSTIDDMTYQAARKRSWDDAIATKDPWPKRQHLQEPQQQPLNPYPSQTYSLGGPLPSLPALPVPHLPLPYSQQQQIPQVTFSNQMFQSVPTNMPGYGAASQAGWLQGVQALAGQPQPNHRAQLAQLSAMSRVTTPSSGGYVPSPLSADGASTSMSTQSFGYENGPQLSPSHYLSKRTSPYRPVRNLNHLVRAPPSSHVAPQYPAQISYDQFQWQPLKKNVSEDERRTGRVPYHERGAWPQHPSVYQ